MRGEPKDPRSTWRKRLRTVLLLSGRPYSCRKCNRTNRLDGTIVDGIPVYVPDDARYYVNLGSLQANHINKVLSDIDPDNGEWLCPSCHKEIDQQTAKGVSSRGDEYGYTYPSPVGDDDDYPVV